MLTSCCHFDGKIESPARNECNNLTDKRKTVTKFVPRGLARGRSVHPWPAGMKEDMRRTVHFFNLSGWCRRCLKPWQSGTEGCHLSKDITSSENDSHRNLYPKHPKRYDDIPGLRAGLVRMINRSRTESTHEKGRRPLRPAEVPPDKQE